MVKHALAVSGLVFVYTGSGIPDVCVRRASIQGNPAHGILRPACIFDRTYHRSCWLVLHSCNRTLSQLAIVCSMPTQHLWFTY